MPLVPHWSWSLTVQPALFVCVELLLWSEAGHEVSLFPVEVLQAVQSPQNTLEGEEWENQNSISSGSLADGLILCSWASFYVHQIIVLCFLSISASSHQELH